MNERIIAVTFPKCGTCQYAQKPDTKGFCDCHGNPPSPLILGSGQDALGRPTFQIEAMVPKVQAIRPACHLYAAKQDFATNGNS